MCVRACVRACVYIFYIGLYMNIYMLKSTCRNICIRCIYRAVSTAKWCNVNPTPILRWPIKRYQDNLEHFKYYFLVFAR